MAKVRLRDDLTLPTGPRRWRRHLEALFDSLLDEEVGSMAIGRQREIELKAFAVATVLAVIEALDAKS